MELVIDIPKDVYEDIMAHNREMRESGKSYYYFEELIQKGTPYVQPVRPLIDNPCIDCGGNYCLHEDCECRKVVPMSVIENIKTELKNAKADQSICWDNGEIHGIDIALGIIDKHITEGSTDV